MWWSGKGVGLAFLGCAQWRRTIKTKHLVEDLLTGRPDHVMRLGVKNDLRTGTYLPSSLES